MPRELASSTGYSLPGRVLQPWLSCCSGPRPHSLHGHAFLTVDLVQEDLASTFMGTPEYKQTQTSLTGSALQPHLEGVDNVPQAAWRLSDLGQSQHRPFACSRQAHTHVRAFEASHTQAMARQCRSKSPSCGDPMPQMTSTNHGCSKRICPKP